jgi:hypothetical protein
MIISFALPWWSASSIDIYAVTSQFSLTNAIRIYGYGLQHDLIGLREYIAADETPLYQTILAWVYMTASAGLALGSTWFINRRSQILLGGIGLIYIIYVSVAVFIVITGRLSDFGLSLQGLSGYDETTYSLRMNANLGFGYYLAYASGGACIVLALLRDLIIGRAK